MTIKEKIEQGKTYLGIEFGSTRIKACLIDDSFAPIAGGSHSWENRLENGIWTYTQDDIITGLQDCYADLKRDVKEKYGTVLTNLGGLGISAMMHGYLAFNSADELLVPFRTWRNTITAEAAEKLTSLFGFNIPERWSIAHLYQAVLNKEEHITDIAHINTLAGYVHFMLTGVRELGIGDASGMFPIENCEDYNKSMMEKFMALDEVKACGWKLRDILPTVVSAGAGKSTLTEDGAKLLDPEGDLKAGISCCPPEGDAGTGMVATNAVRKGTGNISAGTSIFSMLVLNDPLKCCYPEIDVVTTPDGADVAMVHCNNCCGELDKWV
ncbi:MAG: ATPase, partial [Ruminococcus sp.]|nr:ATPase [Ruminococcus sp.]